MCRQESEFYFMLLYLTCLALIAVNANDSDETVDYQKRLLQDIFHNGRIDPKVRPVTGHTNPVDVDAFLTILHVYRLDESTGTLTVNGWAEIHWNDPLMKWDASNYGGLDYIEIAELAVWKPDLTILNPVDASSIFEYGKVQLYVTSNGHVDWVPPFRTRSSCPIDHRYFPYDEQVCKIQFGSWVYDASRLNLKIPNVKVTEEEMSKKFSVENPLWEVVEETAEQINVTLQCCPHYTYPFIEIGVRLRRKSPLYKFVFVMPSVMSMLLTLALFWLPTNSGEKITLGGISVLIQLAMLFALSNAIPPGGTHIPHIVLFCGNSLVMTCFSLILSVVVIRFSRNHTYTPLPSLLKNFLSGPLGLVLCLGTNAGFQGDECILGESKKDPESLEGNQNQTLQSYSEKPTSFNDWILLAPAIDHLGFIIYCVIFGIILVASFAA